MLSQEQNKQHSEIYKLCTPNTKKLNAQNTQNRSGAFHEAVRSAEQGPGGQQG